MTIPICLKSFLDVLLLWHGANSVCVVTEIISLPSCPTQKAHEDMVYDMTSGTRRYFIDIPFSMTIALEDNDNRTAILDASGNEVVIEKGRVAIWRGNYRHSGASYNIFNSRLHVAVCNRDKLQYLEDVYNIEE